MAIFFSSDKVKAFNLKFDEMKTDSNVKKWDVHVLTVSINVTQLVVDCMAGGWAG